LLTTGPDDLAKILAPPIASTFYPS